MSEIIQKPSPNFDKRYHAEPSLIVLHYTGMKTAEEALERLTNAEAKVSSHYTIDEDGEIYQHVDEEKRAWHSGVSKWQGRGDINTHSIGIEIVNPGHEFGYRMFSDAQIESVRALCEEINGRHEIEAVLAHSDIAPDRKEDPGELFPWRKLAEKGIGIWPAVSDEDMVKGAGLEVFQALRDFGYSAVKEKNMLIAFQRHFVPEAFDNKTEGEVCSLTKGRLYALLAGHLIFKQYS